MHELSDWYLWYLKIVYKMHTNINSTIPTLDILIATFVDIQYI